MGGGGGLLLQKKSQALNIGDEVRCQDMKEWNYCSFDTLQVFIFSICLLKFDDFPSDLHLQVKDEPHG